MKTYSAEKYAGRVYCGNGLFDTVNECIDFANDGFCDRLIIFNNKTNVQLKLRCKKGRWGCVASGVRGRKTK